MPYTQLLKSLSALRGQQEQSEPNTERTQENDSTKDTNESSIQSPTQGNISNDTDESQPTVVDDATTEEMVELDADTDIASSRSESPALRPATPPILPIGTSLPLKDNFTTDNAESLPEMTQKEDIKDSASISF